ncbi:hypothetical protein ACS0PU_011344 [Formica fusca]
MSHSYEEKLEEWGLSEYTQKFKDEGIDEQAFLYMPEYMIKELIPTIGKRFRFLENRKKLLTIAKEDSVRSETSTDLATSDIEETVSIGSCSSKESNDNRGQVLKELLSESSCGRKILTQTRLTASDRNKISHFIIDKLLCKSMKVSSADFQKWAEEIVSLFKYETISTYYVPSNAKQKRLANGKLWDKYNNLKRYIKKQTIVENKENTPESADYEEALLTLRAIQPNDPALLKLWEETFSARRKGTSIAQYYDEYPILKSSIATSLIRIDCGIATGIDTLIFQKKWPEICPYVIQIAEKKQACPALCELKHDVPVEVLSLFILPYIINTCHVKTGNKKKWKPSKVEVAESFICRIPVSNLF